MKRTVFAMMIGWYVVGWILFPVSILSAEPDWISTDGLYFREDAADTPQALPITQEHVAHPELTMRMRGAAEKQLKKSHHENHPNDPHYIWSGRCESRWAISWTKEDATADLSGSEAFVRMRTKNYDRTLYLLIRTDQGWFVSGNGANPSEDWTITTRSISSLNWFRLTSFDRGKKADAVNLSSVREIGVTDLRRGNGSEACSRLDWIEVWEHPPERSVYAVRAVDGYQLYDRGEPVLFYHIRENSWKNDWQRTNYIHPLQGLDGQVLTEDFPEDHPYHRGIFWAWQRVYVNEQHAGDAWHLKTIDRTVRKVKVLHDREQAVDLLAFVDWTAPSYRGGDEPFLREKVTIRVFPRDRGQRIIDVQTEFRALADSVRIGGADNDKELGGFAVRLGVPDDIRFRIPSGDVSARRTPVSRAPWCTFTGSFGEGPESGVTVMTHPNTPGFPQRWVLRDRPSMQNPVFPGREPVSVPSDQPLKLHYRLVLHGGELDEEAIFDQFVR